MNIPTVLKAVQLLHIFMTNHGKLWKALMTTHLGDYWALGNRIRKTAAGNFENEQ